MISGNDISFALSGGTMNTNPTQSLGGHPSAYPITSGMNNLFPNYTLAQTNSGYIDYRCIYVFNNHALDSMYGVTAGIVAVSGGAVEYFGTPITTEQQQIVISGNVTGGSFTLSYDAYTTSAIPWSPFTNTWAASIQSALNNLPVLSGVVVSYSASPGLTRFILLFQGYGDHKQHPLLVATNNLTPAGITTTVSKVTNGGPINNIASTISHETITPAGITFVGTGTILDIGTLGPGEGFPVWIKRHLLAGTAAKYNDGLNLQVTCSPI
ncbi:MAG: hypothetical protein M0R80_03215 [Proteobacteria bacterium]|jgi:hypothetical protein|nr:hypothetical protein [Pseudomonadota bacterium]